MMILRPRGNRLQNTINPRSHAIIAPRFGRCLMRSFGTSLSKSLHPRPASTARVNIEVYALLAPHHIDLILT